MNVTMKPEIKTRRRDGTWAVYIRVTFKGVCRRLPTSLAATSSDLTRSGRIRSQDLLDAANAKVLALFEWPV